MVKLINQLNTQEFIWSTSEQLYPFEKTTGGAPLYCKEINLGALPNGGTKSVAHNISGLTVDKIFRHYGNWYHVANNNFSSIPYIDTNSTYNVSLFITSTYINAACATNMSANSGKVRVIYSK